MPTHLPELIVTFSGVLGAGYGTPPCLKITRIVFRAKIIHHLNSSLPDDFATSCDHDVTYTRGSPPARLSRPWRAEPLQLDAVA